MRIQVNLRTHDFNRLFAKLSICHAIFIHHIDICIGKLKAPTWSGQYKLKRSTINVVSSELSLGRLLIIEIALRKVKSFEKNDNFIRAICAPLPSGNLQSIFLYVLPAAEFPARFASNLVSSV